MSVAIIIPTKNRPHYLKDMLASLIPNETELEVYIVDDSVGEHPTEKIKYTDWNKNICQAFSHVLDVVYIDAPTNPTPGQCLRPISFGIKEALKDKHKYIKILGDDDFLEPYTIDFEFNYLKENPYYDSVMTNFYQTDEFLRPTNQQPYAMSDSIITPQMRTGCFITDQIMVDRKYWENLFEKNDGKYFEPESVLYTIGSRWLWLIWYEMVARGLKVRVFPNTFTLRYRQHKDQIKDNQDAHLYNSKMIELFDEVDRSIK